MWTFAARFLADDGGPTAVEYAVMLALIIMAAFVSIVSVGSEASEMWNYIDTSAFGAGLGQ
ncbi:MAG: Flp family type IVb pilin [Planctomycetia bacterium]|nr:Flp family type IVb pilin [Planctomycetia bacterium]